MAGYDTAGQIQNTYSSAHSEFGTDPNFWVRYFTPSPAADIFSDNAEAECIGAWDSGGPHIMCICAPIQSRLSGSTAEGQADAQSMCASMLTGYHAVAPLNLPSSHELWCWLDQEASTSLSLDYWNGWANYIANYNFAGLGTYPLYPGLYCNPDAAYPSCTVIAKATGLNIPVAVWSSEPEPCGKLASPPSWKAESCTSVSKSTVTTKLWQYGEQGACGYSANVDLDVGASGWDMADYSFVVSSKP
jgi:hypothetical protein